MKNKITTNGSSSNMIGLAVIGAGLAGLAGGAYFLLGPKGKRNQKHVKAWAIKMKGDVVEKLEKAKKMSEPIYREIIDSVAMKYEKAKKGDTQEIQELADDLKRHWKVISNEAKELKKDAIKSTRIVKRKTKKSIDEI